MLSTRTAFSTKYPQQLYTCYPTELIARILVKFFKIHVVSVFAFMASNGFLRVLEKNIEFFCFKKATTDVEMRFQFLFVFFVSLEPFSINISPINI